MIAETKNTNLAGNPLRVRSTCRCCGAQRLVRFLSLGDVPLANSFLAPGSTAEELRFPLEVYFCEECSLVQLLHVVNPEVLFSNYVYASGTSSTLKVHNAELAETVVRSLRLTERDLVVEVASNDGSLLKCFKPYGVPTLGVEPAANIAELARAAGVETRNEFFNSECAGRIVAERGPATVILANNVLAHVDEVVDFLAGFARLLKPGGRVIVEVPYLREMLERLEYDTIYHEHLCYFSVTSLTRLFANAGLSLDRVDRVPIHGGSLRVYAKHASEGGHSEAVLQMVAEERAAQVSQLAACRRFADGVAKNRAALLELLGGLKSQGKRVVGYGAPAKGNTLLCYCGIDSRTLPYTVDKSPLKVGLLTPGSRIPVAPFEKILEDQPDYVLILAWNFATEIIASLNTYQERGGCFILPIPVPTIV